MECFGRLHARLTGAFSDRTPQPDACVFCAIAAGRVVDGRRAELLHQARPHAVLRAALLR
jgi:hypothetical protein